MHSTDVDGANVGLPLQEHLDGDHFVARTGGQTVEAGQVDQLEAPSPMFHPAGLLLDRNARIVAHVLVDSHEGSEERRFARIRIADQGNGNGGILKRGRHVRSTKAHEENIQRLRQLAVGCTSASNYMQDGLEGPSYSSLSKSRQRLRNRNDGNLHAVVGAEADFVARHANDAGVSRPEHFDASPAAQTELLKSVNVVRTALDTTDPAALAG